MACQCRINSRMNCSLHPQRILMTLCSSSKVLLDSTSRSRSPLSGDHKQSTQRIHSFNNNGASLGSKRDATIYKHNDSEEHVYQPRNRHVDRSAIRARDDDSPSSDLEDMKRRLQNTAQMLDRAAEADASRTKRTRNWIKKWTISSIA